MALRIKSRWHQSGRNQPSDKAVEDNAGALAFIVWRLSLEGARKLHGEGFEYVSDRERVLVISEFLAFLLQCADRLAYEFLEEDGRRRFVNTLGQRLADQMQDNMEDIAGPGDYRAPFIDLINERLTDYAELGFGEGEPGYAFTRYFGDRVLRIMGEDQTNRWVIDQIMEIDAPDVFERMKQALENLFDTAAPTDPA